MLFGPSVFPRQFNAGLLYSPSAIEPTFMDHRLTMDPEPGSSGLKLRPRKDRRHAVKPYARPETFMTKMASTVTQIIPEWIRNAAQLFKPDENIDNEDNNSGNSEGDAEEYPVAEPSSSLSNPHTSKSTYSVPCSEDPVPVERKQNKRLSAIKIVPEEAKEASNRAPIVGTTTIEVDDEGSSSSENTASSTSGCSSLVPSHQDNLQRLHLPKSSLDRLRQELMKTSDRYARSTTSTKEESTSSRNSAALWTSKSGNREFDASKFIASGSSIPFPCRTVTSPFYPGATKFGGASARRVEMLTSSPYNLNQRKMAPVLRVRAVESSSSSNFTSQDRMSSAARKVLESMDKISSPLGEAKKMPLRGKPSPNRGPTFITSRLNVSQSLRPAVPGTLQVASRNLTVLSSSSEQHKTDTSIAPHSNWKISDVNSTMSRSDKDSTSGLLSLESKLVGGGGGKIKSAKSSGRVPLARDTSNDISNDVILPKIELPPMNNLPSFNFAAEGKEVEPVRKKNNEELVLRSADEGFSISSPLVRSRHSPPPVITEPTNAFKFSLPASLCDKLLSSETSSNNASNEPPKTDGSLSWGDKFKPAAGSWCCPCCMISNSAGSATCVACETVKP